MGSLFKVPCEGIGIITKVGWDTLDPKFLMDSLSTEKQAEFLFFGSFSLQLLTSSFYID